jgi:hypothetical protein
MKYIITYLKLMKQQGQLVFAFGNAAGIYSAQCIDQDQNPIHVWEKVDVTLTARNTYKNPYTDVTVWVDLKGPVENVVTVLGWRQHISSSHHCNSPVTGVGKVGLNRQIQD